MAFFGTRCDCGAPITEACGCYPEADRHFAKLSGQLDPNPDTQLVEIAVNCARHMKREGTYKYLTTSMRQWFEQYEKNLQSRNNS